MSQLDTAGGYTIAVTGPTRTLGFGQIPQLQADDGAERIVGIARHPFDPAGRGWSKMGTGRKRA